MGPTHPALYFLTMLIIKCEIKASPNLMLVSTIKCLAFAEKCQKGGKVNQGYFNVEPPFYLLFCKGNCREHPPFPLFLTMRDAMWSKCIHKPFFGAQISIKLKMCFPDLMQNNCELQCWKFHCFLCVACCVFPLLWLCQDHNGGNINAAKILHAGFELMLNAWLTTVPTIGQMHYEFVCTYLWPLMGKFWVCSMFCSFG